MIVLKNGKKVFPEEIEYLIGQYDYIKESLVWGETEGDGDVDVWVKIVLDRDVIHSEGGDVTDEINMSTRISELIKEVNKKMPSFKSVKYFIFGEDDMAKTTTRKIKRNVELEKMKEILARNSMKVKEAAGRNIDAIKNMLHNDKKDGG
jgi:long-chain acyl-CoA synthetase